MKKIFLLTVLVVLGFTANAQGEFNVGGHIALPVGDATNGWGFGIAGDINYLWDVTQEFDAGVVSGLSYYFGKDGVDNAAFIPIGAGGRFYASDKFTLGLDLGYGIGIAPSGNDGGFYYAPKLQYEVQDGMDAVFSYRGVSIDGFTFGSITLGVEFSL